MIKLSKLDDSPILVSLEVVKYIETTPDTLIHFINGDSIMVRETLDEIALRVIEWKKSILASK